MENNADRNLAKSRNTLTDNLEIALTCAHPLRGFNQLMQLRLEGILTFMISKLIMWHLSAIRLKRLSCVT